MNNKGKINIPKPENFDDRSEEALRKAYMSLHTNHIVLCGQVLDQNKYVDKLLDENQKLEELINQVCEERDLIEKEYSEYQKEFIK